MTSLPRYSGKAAAAIQRLRQDIDGLFQRCDELDPEAEVAADVTRYICVRVCGYLERALTEVARSHCEGSSGGPVRLFALSWLERSPNPRREELLHFVGRFDRAWAQELEALLEDDERGNRVNALLGIRNDIAHGKNQGVSREGAREYFQVVDELVRWLLTKFEPTPRPAT